jgi:hypothetical protein
MCKSKRGRPSSAILVAIVALVVALGGSAVAEVATTSKLSKKEKKQIKKIARKQAKKLDKKIELTPGDPASKLWAVVDTDGSLVRGSGGATSAQLFKPTVDGAYEVDFGQDVTDCALIAALGRVDAADSNPAPGEIGVAYRNGNAQATFVKTLDSGGSEADQSFHLAVFC